MILQDEIHEEIAFPHPKNEILASS